MSPVVIVLPTLSRQGGGVSEAVRRLVDGLAREGVPMRVITTRDENFAADRANWGQAEIEAFRFFGPRGFRFSLGLLWRVLTVEADVLHLHGLWNFMGFAVFLRGVLRGTPYGVSPHGMAEPLVLARSRWRKRVLGWMYQNALLWRAKWLHGLTAAEAGDVAAIAPQVPVVVVPNGVEVQPAEGKRPDWWQAGFEHRKVFVFLGRIHEAKGWRELLEGWALACGESAAFRAGAQLVFCGWMDRAQGFEQAVAEARQALGNVDYAGPQFGDARAKSLAAAHMMVLPSRTEGLPMTVLESWALGTPVMMTRACNLDLGFDRGAALEIGTDARAIAKGLLRGFALGGESRAAMGVAGRSLVAEEFSPRRVARAFARAYADMGSAPWPTPDGQRPSAAAGG